MPGQRMAGRHGGQVQTTLKLEVVEVHPDTNRILVKGAVPGPSKAGLVVVRETNRPLKKKIIHKKPTKKKKGGKK